MGTLCCLKTSRNNPFFKTAAKVQFTTIDWANVDNFFLQLFVYK